MVAKAVVVVRLVVAVVVVGRGLHGRGGGCRGCGCRALGCRDRRGRRRVAVEAGRRMLLLRHSTVFAVLTIASIILTAFDGVCNKPCGDAGCCDCDGWVLGGSWVVKSGVISPLICVISIVTLLITSLEPPSRVYPCLI